MSWPSIWIWTENSYTGEDGFHAHNALGIATAPPSAGLSGRFAAKEGTRELGLGTAVQTTRRTAAASLFLAFSLIIESRDQ